MELEKMWVLWEIVINALECSFFFYVIKRQLGYTTKKRANVYLGLIIMIAIECILNFTGIYFLITTLAMLGLRIVYTTLLFSGSRTQRILWGCSGTFATQAANLIISNVLAAISHTRVGETLVPSGARLTTQVFYILCVIIQFWLFSRIRIDKKIQLPLNLQILMVSIFGIGIFAVGQMVAFSIQMERTQDEHVLLATMSVALLIMLLAIIIAFDRIGKSIWDKANIERQLLENQLDEENKRRTEEMIRAWRHDYHNHLEVMQIHAKNEQWGNLKKYLFEVKSDFDIQSINSTNSSALDAIIVSKIVIAKSVGIRMNCKMSKISDIRMSDTNLCVLVGNLLDNAIEACEKLKETDDTFINFSILENRGMLQLAIKNSTNGVYNYVDNKFISTKQGGNHGYGLPRVSQIIDDAGGFYDIKHTSTEYTIKVFLPIERAM